MNVVLVGAGAVGGRIARQLSSSGDIGRLVVVDVHARRAEAVVGAIGGDAHATTAWSPSLVGAGDVVVLALPGGHRRFAKVALERGAHVVSTASAESEVRSLLAFHVEARERGCHVVVGAAFGPGLTCVLARHAAAAFDEVTEVHVAKAGTGGPACARAHHRALAGASIDWRNGAWGRRPGGSGRELCWFPEPVGGQDCYRANLPDALLLVPALLGVERVTARVAASRRDRLTSRLPMLRPPHPEGLMGAVRVEVRGRRGAARDVVALGAVDRPAVAAGAVAAVAATWAVSGRLAEPGSGGLASLVSDPVPFLQELARRGVKAAVFEGSAAGAAAVAG